MSIEEILVIILDVLKDIKMEMEKMNDHLKELEFQTKIRT